MRDETIRNIGRACYRRHGKRRLTRLDDKTLNLASHASHRLRGLAKGAQKGPEEIARA
jgi:hypothetical protein